MTMGNIWFCTLLSLPLAVFLIRRGFWVWLGTVLLLWLLAVIHGWRPENDNNWGAATLAVGWFPIGVYCALCYALAGLFAPLRRKAAAWRRRCE